MAEGGKHGRGGNGSEGVSDVLIIGGGPAGSTAAALLAKLGHTVTLFEKEKFPREHVGESLLPFCYDLFKELGVVEQLTGSFVRKPGVRFVNSLGTVSTRWCFSHIIHDERYLSFQVVRSEFDRILLANARKHGAQVHEQVKVEAVELESEGGLVRVRATGPDWQGREFQGRFLIDASGRDCFLQRSKKWRKPHPNLERTALWTHWDGVEQLKGGLEEGMSIIVYLGGSKRGWVWVFPIGRTSLTVGVVLDSASLREGKTAALEAEHDDWRTGVYLEELRQSPFVQELLAGGKMSKQLMVEADYSYFSDQKYGPNFALVGDASRFIDPIFSSGVYLSMKSSALVAGALHERFAGGDGVRALDAAYERINGAYNLIYRLISLYYTPDAISFAEAASAFDPEYERHQAAVAAAHFLLAGDFFENHKKYDEFLTFMAEKRAFGKFKSFVIDREQFYADKCLDEGVEIFPEPATT